MQPGMVDGKFINTAFFAKGIIIFSIGQKSDNFIKVLSNLYNQKYKNHYMVTKIEFTSCVLEGNPLDFNTEDLKFKVFYDDNNKKGLYSELYINVSVTKGIIEMKDKDIGYRKNIYQALIGKKPNIFVCWYKHIFKKI